MANSTSNLTQLSTAQILKEATVNALVDAASPATLFGRNSVMTSALTWGYFGGTITVDGVLTQIANGTVALTGSTTNYVEADRTGTVSKNTTGFTAGRTPLYQIVAGSATITSWTDFRITSARRHGVLVRAMPSDANYTLAAAEASNDILEFAGGSTLTATRNIVVPLVQQQWTVFNNTTGAQSLQFIGASGTGITVATGKRAIVYSNGTNVVRVTADV